MFQKENEALVVQIKLKEGSIEFYCDKDITEIQVEYLMQIRTFLNNINLKIQGDMEDGNEKVQ